MYRLLLYESGTFMCDSGAAYACMFTDMDMCAESLTVYTPSGCLYSCVSLPFRTSAYPSTIPVCLCFLPSVFPSTLLLVLHGQLHTNMDAAKHVTSTLAAIMHRKQKSVLQP